jgi:hypothetical protein
MAPPALQILTTSGSSAANKKAHEMVVIIEDESIWVLLAQYKTFFSSLSFRLMYHL